MELNLDSNVVSFILLFVPIISAFSYRFFLTWNYTRFRFLTMPDLRDYLFFNSIISGIFGLPILLILGIKLQDFSLYNIFAIYHPSSIIIYPTIIAFTFVLPLALNLTINRNAPKYLMRVMEKSQDSLYMIIFNSVEKGYLVELTLTTGEIFIGFPSRTLSFRYKYIDLIPYAIANYDGETKKITSEFWVIYNQKKKFDYSRYQVSVKTEEILVAKKFNPQDYF